MNDERQLLRETVAALVTKHAGPAAVRAAMESDRGYDESLWQLLCEQVGAAALVIPEELGGAGGELADATIVLQELGRGLVPSPLLGTTLAELALLAAPQPDAETLEGLAEGRSIGALVLDADYVVNGDIADVIVGADRFGLLGPHLGQTPRHWQRLPRAVRSVRWYSMPTMWSTGISPTSSLPPPTAN